LLEPGESQVAEADVKRTARQRATCGWGVKNVAASSIVIASTSAIVGRHSGWRDGPSVKAGRYTSQST
jgi:hypothetical protein